MTLPQEIRRAVEMGRTPENSEYKRHSSTEGCVTAGVAPELRKLSKIDVSQIPP